MIGGGWIGRNIREKIPVNEDEDHYVIKKVATITATIVKKS